MEVINEMSGIWLISYLGLWLLVFLLTVVVLALARQIGVLNTRLGHSGARMINAGPEIDDPAPVVTVPDLSGEELVFGGARGRPSLLVFMSTGCGSCAALAPAVRTIWKSERRRVDVKLVSMYSGRAETIKFLERYKMSQVPCTVALDVNEKYQVMTAPYAVLLDAEGVVRSKGAVNHAEHLESLLNVLDEGYASVQDWYYATVEPLPATADATPANK